MIIQTFLYVKIYLNKFSFFIFAVLTGVTPAAPVPGQNPPPYPVTIPEQGQQPEEIPRGKCAKTQQKTNNKNNSEKSEKFYKKVLQFRYICI